jgi:hypothetical protein
VENRAFGHRRFAYELLLKVLLLKSHYMFGNCIFKYFFNVLLMFGNKTKKMLLVAKMTYKDM